jgi:hypothetical protein
VAIPKDAFGKEFLLSASIIPQIVAATSTSLAGKIVQFELFHDGVDLYESTEGLVVTKDLPARRLLTTFPIIPQDDPAKVVIDFNAGMRRAPGMKRLGHGAEIRCEARALRCAEGDCDSGLAGIQSVQ